MNVHSSLMHYGFKLEKVKYIHTMVYYPTMKKNKLLHTMPWVALIGIVLSEIEIHIV